MKDRPSLYLGSLALTMAEMVTEKMANGELLAFKNKFKNQHQIIKLLSSLLGCPYNPNGRETIPEEYKFIIYKGQENSKSNIFLNGGQNIPKAHCKFFQQSDHYEILNDITERLELLFPNSSSPKTKKTGDEMKELERIAPLFEGGYNENTSIIIDSLDYKKFKELSDTDILKSQTDKELQNRLKILNQLSAEAETDWDEFRKKYKKIVKKITNTKKFKQELEEGISRVNDETKKATERRKKRDEQIRQNVAFTGEVTDEIIKQVNTFKYELCRKLLDDIEFSVESADKKNYQKNCYKKRSHILDQQCKDSLKKLFTLEKYDIILAYFIFYLATYRTNKVELSTVYEKYYNNLVRNLDRERNYTYYKKYTSITPKLNQGIFHIETKIIFKSIYINPVREERNKWTFFEEFPTATLRETFNIISLTVNGTDYSDKIKSEEIYDAKNTGLEYKKEFSVDKIPSSESYQVEFIYTCERNIIYYQTPSHLAAPFYNYYFVIEIKGDHADKFDIELHPFFSRKINYLKKSNTNSLSLEFSINPDNEPPINYGHVLTIIPKPHHRMDICLLEHYKDIFANYSDKGKEN